MSQIITIGIDNGVSSGAIVALGQCGSWIGAITMPITKHRTRNEVNIRAVHLWLSEITGGNLSNAEYIIEEPNNAQTPSTAASMAGCFHALRGFFETKMLNWHRTTPQAWQKAMLGKVPKGETKTRALAVARDLWPDETFFASPRCKTPHSGIVDASLISEYLRRKNEL